MKIVLHEFRARSLYSSVTALVTASSISHASIITDKAVYDTNIERGYFGERTQTLEDRYASDRIVTVFYIKLDAQRKLLMERWIEDNLGKPYNRRGLFFWPFNVRVKNHMYCFEAIEFLLRHLGIEINPSGGAISGKTIMSALTELGIDNSAMQTRQMYNSIYTGEWQ